LYDALLEEFEDDSTRTPEEEEGFSLQPLAEVEVEEVDDELEPVEGGVDQDVPVKLDDEGDLLAGLDDNESWSDDPVRMYLTQMGEIPLLTRQQEDSEAEAARKVREFEEAVEEAVPNYRVLDKDEGWLTWLDEEDAATGLVRQEILTRHCARLDAPKVVKMFQAYLAQAAAAAPQVPEPPIAPSGSGATGGDTPPQLPRGAGTGYPTQAEIKDFFKRSATKKPGDVGFVTDKERAEFEARLRLPRR